MTLTEIVHEHTYGKTQIGQPFRTRDAYRRNDVYVPNDTEYRPETMSTAVVGPDDVSPPTDSCDYDAKCACCWLGHSHSQRVHDRDTGKSTSDPKPKKWWER